MDYRIQIVVLNGYNVDQDVYCTCGHNRKIKYSEKAGICPKCGVAETKNFNLNYRGYYEYTDNIFKVVNKTDQGFHIKGEEFVVSLDAHEKKITTVSKNVRTLAFSLKDKNIILTKNGKNIPAIDTNVNTFFKGAPKDRVLNTISTDRNKELYRVCYERLSCMGYERNKMWGRGLRRLKTYPVIETIGLSPLVSHLDEFWVFHTTLTRSKETMPPHKLLEVPKFMLNYLSRMRTYPVFKHERIKQLCRYFDGNSLKLIMQLFDEESDINKVHDVAETLIEVHRDYGYSDLRRTILYIVREVKLEQGIVDPSEAITLVRDLARMSIAMEKSFAKYPKSLKKDHDVALANYKTRENEYKQKEFAKVTEYRDYRDLSLTGKSFSIIRPTHVREVIKEGETLSHCVSSYVDDIIKRKCKILFLRKTEQLDESLVTIEVRGNVVRQVRGRFNRRPEPEESAFIESWAKTKKLEVQCH
ncbi:PcfJ domain-containing protein [Bacillus inaquosorum]|uniref:PcfJ domain-containing protein n=1 Tax=Bacillus inaquosorum TaxID=483913 RepID=UPI0028FC332F|nr:PcfJ domain-containing protein [Bacillus inaquosorum]WNW25037.1 PcfJ domain-containing protein [Bacillus inaquosorum]